MQKHTHTKIYTHKNTHTHTNTHTHNTYTHTYTYTQHIHRAIKYHYKTDQSYTTVGITIETMRKKLRKYAWYFLLHTYTTRDYVVNWKIERWTTVNWSLHEKVCATMEQCTNWKQFQCSCVYTSLDKKQKPCTLCAYMPCVVLPSMALVLVRLTLKYEYWNRS